MRIRILTGTLAAVWTVAAVAVGAQGAPASVLKGVYTAEQAKRGAAVYAETCATCHGPKLEGGEMAPALSGPDFAASWTGQSLADLFIRVHEDMPQDNPGTLTPEQAADAVAHILSVNKYPAGTTELAKDKAALKSIKIEAAK